MKNRPTKTNQGIKLEYNPNNHKDLKLAIEVARHWHQRGSTENSLIPNYDIEAKTLSQAA